MQVAAEECRPAEPWLGSTAEVEVVGEQGEFVHLDRVAEEEDRDGDETDSEAELKQVRVEDKRPSRPVSIQLGGAAGRGAEQPSRVESTGSMLGLLRRALPGSQPSQVSLQSARQHTAPHRRPPAGWRCPASAPRSPSPPRPPSRRGGGGGGRPPAPAGRGRATTAASARLTHTRAAPTPASPPACPASTPPSRPSSRHKSSMLTKVSAFV